MKLIGEFFSWKLFLYVFNNVFLIAYFFYRFKGFCYVEFENLSDLQQAIDLNGMVVIDSNTIKIDVADGKRNDRGGGFDRRGRGNSSIQSGGGGGFGRRDGGRGYGDDYNNTPSYSSMSFKYQLL